MTELIAPLGLEAPGVFPYGEVVAVVRAVRVADPYTGAGSDALDWSNPTVKVVSGLCPVYPTQVEETTNLSHPLLATKTLTCLMPYGTDVNETDRVRVDTGPYTAAARGGGPSDAYDIVQVRHWKNPIVGWAACTEATLTWGGNHG